MRTKKNRVGIGVDLGGTSIKYAVGTRAGKILKEDQRPSHAKSEIKKVLDNLGDAINQMRDYAESEGYQPIAVGMGTPGSVEIEKGYLMGSTPNFRYWRDVYVADELKARVGLPVFVDNDANLMALGEAKYGSGVGHQNIICVTIGTGVGGGIIINGELYRGAFCAGAELGHSTLVADGLACNCGGDGCLEMYASATAMIKYYKEKHLEHKISLEHQDLDVKYIFEQYHKGNQIAKQTIDQCAYYLGRGLASFINIFNPNIIIIGGGVAKAGDIFINKVKETTIKYTMDIPRENVDIVAASLGNRAGFIGALAYAFNRVDSKE
jgi:glucokinase